MTEPTPPASDAEPDTVTDPAWLSTQYAKAIAADDGHPWDTLPADRQENYLDNADAVMRVRDRHVEQLRQRLTLADQVHRDDLAELRRMRLLFEENVRRHNATRGRVDELLAQLRALQGVADADSKQLAEVDERCDRYAATLDRVRRAVHIADAVDVTDWQRGYRACADRVVAELDSKQAQAWTPPPPGDTREQLPEHLLDLIRDHMTDYTSTACQTAETLALASMDPYREPAERLHQRCRLNNKFTGQLCVCGCH